MVRWVTQEQRVLKVRRVNPENQFVVNQVYFEMDKAGGCIVPQIQVIQERWDLQAFRAHAVRWVCVAFR